MKDIMRVFAAAAVVAGLASTASAQAVTCTPTGFFRDGINMTAAYINPASVPSPIDAAGCNIGIYFDHLMVGTGTVERVDIYGANYFGVLVNADAGPVAVNIRDSYIHNIGEVPFNGSQHGIGIYIRGFYVGNAATGEVVGNTIFAYQKGGIVVNGRGARLQRVANNRVVGQGHVSYIAQNGIQIGYGAMPYPSQVVGNAVSGHSYIGTPGDGSSSAGILIVGGPGYGVCPDGADCPYSTFVVMVANTLLNNDVGIYSSNVTADFSAPPTPTEVVIYKNQVGSDFCYNQSYQAGISEQGNGDYIYFNYAVQGGGYGPVCGLGIDITGSVNVQQTGNNVPPTSTATIAAAGAAAPGGVKISPVK